MDDYNEGDQVVVDFDLRGREWNDKYFTNLNAWRVGVAGDNNGSGGSASGTNKSKSGGPEDADKYPPSATDANADFDDDIPF